MKANEVLCLDNFSTGHARNIDHLRQSRLHGCSPRRHRALCRRGGRDLQSRLPCLATGLPGRSDPHHEDQCARRAQPARTGKARSIRIFQASTSEIYGDPHVHPQPESYWGNVNPIGPRSCYDEGKRCAETLFFDFHHRHGVEIKVARIFNTYGPRMRPEDGRVVSNFIVQALKGDDITIYGDGSQTRSFCFVDDLIDGFVRLMNSAPIGHRSGQSRQSRRIHHPRTGRAGDRPHRLAFEDRPSAPAGRRSAAASPRHLACSARTRLASQDPAAEGLRQTIRYFDRLLASELPELAETA